MPSDRNETLLRPSLLVLALALALTLLATACVGARGPVSTGGGPVPDAAPSTAAATTTDNRARIIVVVEENKNADEILGSGRAPFIEELAREGVVLGSYYGVAHPSLPNYLALLGGDTFGISTDCTDCTVDAVNLVDQLEQADVSWKGYFQGLPDRCATDDRVGDYVIRHNPFMYYDGVRENHGRCVNVVPFDELRQDLADNVLPRFSLVVPDLQHDMHDGSIAEGDRWLRDLYEMVRSSPAWQADVRLVVTFDEGTGDEGCCGGLATGGHILTIVAGSRVPGGVHDDTAYSHYSLLRSVEEAFGLPLLRHAADPATASIPALTRPR